MRRLQVWSGGQVERGLHPKGARLWWVRQWLCVLEPNDRLRRPARLRYGCSYTHAQNYSNPPCRWLKDLDKPTSGTCQGGPAAQSGSP